MNWGDELCGVKVTPESWAGGVIEHRRKGTPKWKICPPQKIQTWHSESPIFPPKNWAGKTDAELFHELGFSSVQEDGFGRGIDLCEPVIRCGKEVALGLTGNIHLLECEEYEGDQLQAGPQLDDMILALQNAQVLARRLEVQDG